MAGKRPFFITGANAKVKVNNKTLAFCTNLSYSVNINHATPRILGMFEPTGVEPLSYVVTGQFTVVRYIADAQSATNTSPNGTSETGNGVGSWGEKSYFEKLKAGLRTDEADARTNESLIPKDLTTASGFNIEVFQKTSGSGTIGVAKIRGARITRADFSLGLNSAGTQTFNFTAVYADEDSFIADFSGLGQQNT
jgi:hypothetical protein